ncbi:Stp1/IreP family PP2C-type Ser/Thr phosphatase [Anoxynatronum sibiricum]|uniref:Stp1/IreP family PP2C-type Ser/Thr phosphatase n=1 Tax=Anoxynatronum sibiricum TaxID=210623 RepID=A0ABU9VRJ7_9CLOT
MRTGVCTDAGKIREINQDDYGILENGYGLYIVADGMGGHQCGEVASRMAVEAVLEHVRKYASPDLDNVAAEGLLFEAIQRANRRILDHARLEPSCSGMGTTLTALFHSPERSIVGHVGDSRAYLLRNNTLTQLTRDHSLVAELYLRGEITEAEAMNHPQKHVITRALGISDTIKTDFLSIELQTHDQVLLCTDGLTNMVSDADITLTVLQAANEQEAARNLVELANKQGGHDNITVLLVNAQPDQKESR